MKTYHVSYSYDIKSKVTDEVIFWKRDGFNIDIKKGEDLDTSLIKARVYQLAQDKVDELREGFVSYANYYRIAEVTPKKSK